MEKFAKITTGGDTIEGLSFGLDKLVCVQSEYGAYTETTLLYRNGGEIKLTHGHDYGTPVKTGTADGDTANKLVDSAGGFGDGTTGPVFVGDIAFNTTDGTAAPVTAVADTELTFASDLFPDGNEDYVVSPISEVAQMVRKIQELQLTAAPTHWTENVFEFTPPVTITEFIRNGAW